MYTFSLDFLYPFQFNAKEKGRIFEWKLTNSIIRAGPASRNITISPGYICLLRPTTPNSFVVVKQRIYSIHYWVNIQLYGDLIHNEYNEPTLYICSKEDISFSIGWIFWVTNGQEDKIKSLASTLILSIKPRQAFGFWGSSLRTLRKLTIPARKATTTYRWADTVTCRGA